MVGDGPVDLVYVPGWVSNVEAVWMEPLSETFMLSLAEFSRLILFDKRGTGLSDRNVGLPTLEERMDDVRAVMDAACSERAFMFGVSEGGVMSILFAATYPERTLGLVTFGTFAKRIWSPDYPWAPTPEQREGFYHSVEFGWDGEMDLRDLAPSLDPQSPVLQRFATYARMGASPAAALGLAKMNTQADVVSVLPSVHVPTLVLNREGDKDAHADEARFIASRIPGAKCEILPGDAHIPYLGDHDSIISAVREFVTGSRHASEPGRVLATVLFQDIVDSTGVAARSGDRDWKHKLTLYEKEVLKAVGSMKGKYIKSTGDGFLATFDGPARAMRAAHSVREIARHYGIETRTGLHTGEIELHGDDIAGIAVNIASRVASLAQPGKMLVSSTVKDISAGSGIDFEPAGEHVLKGVPGTWTLYDAQL